MNTPKEQILVNLDCGITNPRWTLFQIIDALYTHGVKDSWYKSLEGTVRNLVLWDNGYFDKKYCKSIVNEGIDWDNTHHEDKRCKVSNAPVSMGECHIPCDERCQDES